VLSLALRASNTENGYEYPYTRLMIPVYLLVKLAFGESQ
jgi:hypothetical protein